MSAMNADQLATIAFLVAETAVSRDNVNLAAENRVLREDMRRLIDAAYDIQLQNSMLEDHVVYLEGLTRRLMDRCTRMEEALLDCQCGEGPPPSVRRRLNYDSGSDLETHDYLYEVIDLTTDEVLTP